MVMTRKKQLVESELSHYRDQLLVLKADITKVNDRQRILDNTIVTDRVDVLVNNAGVAAKNGFLKESEKEYDFILDVNLKGADFLSQVDR